MKKILSAILICTLVLSMAGCGQRQTPDGGSSRGFCPHRGRKLSDGKPGD